MYADWLKVNPNLPREFANYLERRSLCMKPLTAKVNQSHRLETRPSWSVLGDMQTR